MGLSEYQSSRRAKKIFRRPHAAHFVRGLNKFNIVKLIKEWFKDLEDGHNNHG